MSRAASPRLPFGPWPSKPHAPTIDTLASRIGVSRRTVHRWATHGVPADQADRAAIALGTHPACLWPDYWHTHA